MKIGKREKIYVSFSELKDGDVFEYFGVVWMKTATGKSDAIRLFNGTFDQFDQTENVIRYPDAELDLGLPG